VRQTYQKKGSLREKSQGIGQGTLKRIQKLPHATKEKWTAGYHIQDSPFQ
jgi:hypothetical protein